MRDTCLECGADIHRLDRPCSAFCSEAHRYRYRYRLRYQADPEREREKSRRSYAANREKKLEHMRQRERGS